jgi:hypothetical protein
MALVARASNTVRNKNLLIILMCAVFLVMFVYDGYIGYPRNNDRTVAQLLADMSDPGSGVSDEFKSDLETWDTNTREKGGGWTNADDATRRHMDEIVTKINRKQRPWKSVLDIAVQRWIVLGLGIATVAAIWWFIHCQRRRAIAEETTVSPARGVVVPWDKISQVDNTRWKSTGIVEITFPGPDGTPRKAKFDDYELDRKPLLDILDMLADKAVNAEFIPKEEPASEAAAGLSPEPTKP